jgi:NADPH:quinone reductase-like Zn-dependent oxidoreductase
MSNQIAWLDSAGTDLQVGQGPMPTPGPEELVIQIRAIAINPMDAYNQKQGFIITGFPAILGSDGAGEVHAVGSSVKGFTVGDRVTACFDGIPPFPKADYRRSSFQKFAVARASLTAKLPDSVSFVDASVLPLAITSAGDGLFNEHGMQLDLPQVTGPAKPNGKTVIVWAASSSIGTSAIQLLVAAGYDIAAVARAHNHDLLRSIGAKHVFDHTSTTVIEDIVRTFKDANIAGVFTSVMAKDALDKAIEVYVGLGKRGKLGSPFPPGIPAPTELLEGVDLRRSKFHLEH